MNKLGGKNVWCPKCKEKDLDKLKIINKKEQFVTDYFTFDQWLEIEFTIECLSCGHKFEETI